MRKLESSVKSLTRPFRFKEKNAQGSQFQAFISKFKLPKPNRDHKPYGILASKGKPKDVPYQKWSDCVHKVGAKGDVDNAYAVCNATLMRKYQQAMQSKENKDCKQCQADAASSNTASVSAGVNDPLKKKKEAKITFRSRFMESSAGADDTGTKFRVILIQQGLGNFNDCFFYTQEALSSAVPIFEGKKIYADHPSAIDEATRPERSVKDVLGHFEDVELVENEEGQFQIEANVCVLPEDPYQWARALLTHSVDYAQKYPDKDFIGLSINASGDAVPTPIDQMLESDLPDSVKQKLLKAKTEGVETIKLVSVINEAVSCDLVTEAGAGGKVLEMLEKEKKVMAKKESKEKKEKKEAEGKGTDEVNQSGDATKENPSIKAEKKEAEDGAVTPKKSAPADDADGDGDETHDDEDQDKALIQKMISQYLGKDDQDNEEAKQLCKEIYEAYKEMGYEAAEAMEATGHSMKLAKHMAAKETEAQEAEAEGKEHEAEAESKEHSENEAESEAEAESHKEDDGGEQPPVPKKSKKPDNSSAPKTADAPQQKESSVIKLQAQVASLTEQLNKINVEKHLEKVLRESGMSRAATAKFRESIGEAKSIKQIDNDFKIFSEAYKAARGSETDGMPFSVSAEKRTSGTAKAINFSDCAE